MLPYKLLSFTTAVGCAILLTLAALGVSAQSVDVTAICPGGDGSRPVKLAPADSHTMEISCEESSETCRIKHTVTMNEEAGTTLCVTANGAPYTVTVNQAVAMQTWDSGVRVDNTCSRMVNDTNQRPDPRAATFRNAAVGWAWGNATGSIVTVSVCGNPERDVVVCGSGGVEAAKGGVPQLCGDAGLYQAVYTGTDSRSTNGCIGSAVRLYFTVISVPPNTNGYTIYTLAFGEPVVTSVVNLNGTQQTVTGSAASDVSVRITVDTPSPLEGYFMATQGRSNPPVVGRSRMLPGSCTGYCAFRKDSETQYWLPMSSGCAGANPDCDASTAGFCEAHVQLFTESSEDITLPYRTPDGTVEYTLNAQQYVVATTQGSAVPLKGVFVFNETAAERVTAEGAARDLSGAKIQVLPQDAQHKDIVVVRAGGEVVAASSACKFALRSVRGTDRMYSVTNVLGEPTCDLMIGNGVEQRTFNVDTPAKASGARDVGNVEPLWNEVVDESGKKNLPLILGLSLGLGIPFVGAIAIVVGLCCCRRRETCCFAEDNECPAWLTKWSRRATDCCCGKSTDDDNDVSLSGNPMEKLPAGGHAEDSQATSKVESMCGYEERCGKGTSGVPTATTKPTQAHEGSTSVLAARAAAIDDACDDDFWMIEGNDFFAFSEPTTAAHGASTAPLSHGGAKNRRAPLPHPGPAAQVQPQQLPPSQQEPSEELRLPPAPPKRTTTSSPSQAAPSDAQVRLSQQGNLRHVKTQRHLRPTTSPGPTPEGVSPVDGTGTLAQDNANDVVVPRGVNVGAPQPPPSVDGSTQRSGGETRNRNAPAQNFKALTRMRSVPMVAKSPRRMSGAQQIVDHLEQFFDNSRPIQVDPMPDDAMREYLDISRFKRKYPRPTKELNHEQRVFLVTFLTPQEVPRNRRNKRLVERCQGETMCYFLIFLYMEWTELTYAVMYALVDEARYLADLHTKLCEEEREAFAAK